MQVLRANLTFLVPDDFEQSDSIPDLLEAIAAHIRSSDSKADRPNVSQGTSHHSWFYNLKNHDAKLTGQVGVFRLEKGKNWVEILPNKVIVF
jgi:hypothetical protein